MYCINNSDKTTKQGREEVNFRRCLLTFHVSMWFKLRPNAYQQTDKKFKLT
jgi:hypothetical protein